VDSPWPYGGLHTHDIIMTPVTIWINTLAMLQLNATTGNGGMSESLMWQSERWPNLRHKTARPRRRNVYKLFFESYFASSGNGQKAPPTSEWTATAACWLLSQAGRNAG
jgi:hypothetical protein